MKKKLKIRLFPIKWNRTALTNCCIIKPIRPIELSLHFTSLITESSWPLGHQGWLGSHCSPFFSIFSLLKGCTHRAVPCPNPKFPGSVIFSFFLLICFVLICLFCLVLFLLVVGFFGCSSVLLFLASQHELEGGHFQWSASTRWSSLSSLDVQYCNITDDDHSKSNLLYGINQFAGVHGRLVHLLCHLFPVTVGVCCWDMDQRLKHNAMINHIHHCWWCWGQSIKRSCVKRSSKNKQTKIN